MQHFLIAPLQRYISVRRLFLPRVITRLIFALVLAASLLAESAQFTDIAANAGLNDIFYRGRDDQKDYLIEALGGGVALFDYDLRR